MLVIPAIDIKDSKVVCLLQGRYEEVTVYSHDPVEMARTWEKQEANRIHIVDLDGAMAGEVKNLITLRKISKEVRIPVQFGGGVRSYADINAVLDAGAKWVIIGTKACEDLNFIKEVVAEFDDKIIISIDVKYHKVATKAWTETTSIEDVDLIKKLQDVGVNSFIYTDISRDGTLAGSNVKGVQKVLEQTSVSMFYSGGISSLEDVKHLKALEKFGLSGIIIGKALYENRIHLVQIKRILGGES